MSTRLAWAVFDLALRPWMAMHLRVHLAGLPRSLPADQPVLLCPNHESFWDGFLMRHLQRRILPGASFHAVMLNRELAPRPWLRSLGAVGVEPGSVGSVRGMLHSLRGLARRSPAPVLAYFPQGRIRPGAPTPLGFHPGVDRVARLLAPATVLPVGLRILPGRTSRMDAFVSVGSPLYVPGPDRLTPGLLEEAVSEELHAIGAWVARHGEDAAERWPAGGARLPRARGGLWVSHDFESWISRN